MIRLNSAASFISYHRSSHDHFHQGAELSPRARLAIGRKTDETWSTTPPIKKSCVMSKPSQALFPTESRHISMIYQKLSSKHQHSNTKTYRGKGSCHVISPLCPPKNHQTSARKASCWTIKELGANSQHIR